MNNSFSVNTNQIKDLIRNNSIIIDIRDEYEYKKQHIKTSINIPYNRFHIYKKQFNKNTPIYIICHYGQRSKQLVQDLRKEGYEAYSFIGGFYALTHTINNTYF